MGRHCVELYAPLLFYWCRQAGLREPDAADAVQEVLVTLIKTTRVRLRSRPQLSQLAADHNAK